MVSLFPRTPEAFDSCENELMLPSSPDHLLASALPQQPSYQVLARKYRLKSFEWMIGQKALVKILTQCIEKNQVPQAFLLTGIRGVGKTTTARIIARALNCIGKDGKSGPTATPCQECIHCQAIDQDRHLDVIEMDAASHTGVDDIRDVIEAAKYKAISGRYKIYIIDEVHMLSKNAFNALLKTLEEPPDHLKFIFATTEGRRLPETIVSRCMRFNLVRVSIEELTAYFAKIVSLEQKKAEAPALHLIAKAAEGSVRDGLSLLDQALSLCSDMVTEQAVREMLHCAESADILKILDYLMEGHTAPALALYQDLYVSGKDSMLIAHQLLESVTNLALVKVNPQVLSSLGLDSQDEKHLQELAETLSMPVLVRFWQVLLKGLQEMQTAPSPFQAGQMVMIRLAYQSSLPTPQALLDLLAKEQEESLSDQASAGSSLSDLVSFPKSQSPHLLDSRKPLQDQTVLFNQTRDPRHFSRKKDEINDSPGVLNKEEDLLKEALKIFPGSKIVTSTAT